MLFMSYFLPVLIMVLMTSCHFSRVITKSLTFPLDPNVSDELFALNFSFSVHFADVPIENNNIYIYKKWKKIEQIKKELRLIEGVEAKKPKNILFFLTRFSFSVILQCHMK